MAWALSAALHATELQHQDVLYNLTDDPYEENDLSDQHPDVKANLLLQVLKYDAIKPEKEVLPFDVGREGFVPPKEWNIFIQQ